MQSGQPQRPMQQRPQPAPQRPQYQPQYRPQQPTQRPTQPQRSMSRYEPQYEPQERQQFQEREPRWSPDYGDYGAYNEPRGGRGGMDRSMDRSMDRGISMGASPDRGFAGRREYSPQPDRIAVLPQSQAPQAPMGPDPSMGHPFSPYRKPQFQQQEPMFRGGGPMFDPDQAASMESAALDQMSRYGGPAKGVSQLTQREESGDGGYSGGGGYPTAPSYRKSMSPRRMQFETGGYDPSEGARSPDFY